MMRLPRRVRDIATTGRAATTSPRAAATAPRRAASSQDGGRNTTRSVVRLHVRADVGLDEAARPRDEGDARVPDVEMEGDQPDPGRPAERIDPQPGGEERLHDLGRIRPVQEAQVGPAMDLHGAGPRQRRLRSDDGGGSRKRRGERVREPLIGPPLLSACQSAVELSVCSNQALRKGEPSRDREWGAAGAERPTTHPRRIVEAAIEP